MKKENGRKMRSSFTSEQKRVMSNWINTHSTNPYPTDEEKISIANETGLNVKQVAIWFTNTRKVS